ncbi:MAG: ABC transporter permease [Bacteroidetes bacterium]|nr:ABC transporter permease [Bacteroidota bacterium]
MLNIGLKEWKQFFTSLTGYIALCIFLLVTGLLLFVFPDTSILAMGYATLAAFFNLAPWLLIFMVPTITMRSFSEEYKTGTFELLKTLPIKPATLVWGKYVGALLVVLCLLLPTLFYGVAVESLSAVGGLDMGATAGSYLGLLLLGAVFVAIGICISSYTNNTVVAFIGAAFTCYLLFAGFEAASKLSMFDGKLGYYIEVLGIKFHYKSMSRGVLRLDDLVYFMLIIFSCFYITQQNIRKR